MTTILRRTFLRYVRQGDIIDPWLNLFKHECREIEAELIGVNINCGSYYHCQALKKDADKFVSEELTDQQLLMEFI